MTFLLLQKKSSSFPPPSLPAFHSETKVRCVLNSDVSELCPWLQCSGYFQEERLKAGCPGKPLPIFIYLSNLSSLARSTTPCIKLPKSKLGVHVGVYLLCNFERHPPFTKFTLQIWGEKNKLSFQAGRKFSPSENWPAPPFFTTRLSRRRTEPRFASFKSWKVPLVFKEAPQGSPWLTTRIGICVAKRGSREERRAWFYGPFFFCRGW